LASSDLPEIDRKDLIVLGDLRKQRPEAFYSNMTSFLLSEMYAYLKDARCWRLSIMGETRGGKSEVAQTIALSYVNMFNHLLRRGLYDYIDLFRNGFFKKQEINLSVDHICSSQSDYIYTLRQKHKDGLTKFGQIWIIDESKKAIGGLGSFSEMMDLENVNNIIAKFMQSEIWVQPLQLETKNTPYGLYVYKKDIVNKVNWCLLYKIQRTPTGGVEYTFLGWVRVPLHGNTALREAYNKKKNEWINQEMEGRADIRLEERKRVALELSKDKMFSMRTPSGKIFKLSKAQQITILEDWILQGRTQNWNQVERMMIVEEARRLAEETYQDSIRTVRGDSYDDEKKKKRKKGRRKSRGYTS